jgi:hypothetical protein
MKNSGELRIAKDAPWEELYDLVREMAGIGELTGSDDMVDESMLLCLCVFMFSSNTPPVGHHRP